MPRDHAGGPCSQFATASPFEPTGKKYQSYVMVLGRGPGYDFGVNLGSIPEPLSRFNLFVLL